MCCHPSDSLLLIREGCSNGRFISLTDESKVWTREHQFGAAHEGQGDSGRAIEHGSGGGQEVPPLVPHPFPPPPPPPPMTPAEIMVELLAARWESAAAC